MEAPTGAVTVCGRLRDGAGERTAANLRGALVEFLLLVSKLDLYIKEKEKERKPDLAKGGRKEEFRVEQKTVILIT